jgi:hypothetical protein
MIKDGIDTLAIESYLAEEGLTDDEVHDLAASTGLSYEQLDALRPEEDREDEMGDGETGIVGRRPVVMTMDG